MAAAAASARDLRALNRQAMAHNKPTAAKHAAAVATGVTAHLVPASVGQTAVKKIRAKANLPAPAPKKKTSSSSDSKAPKSPKAPKKKTSSSSDSKSPKKKTMSKSPKSKEARSKRMAKRKALFKTMTPHLSQIGKHSRKEEGPWTQQCEKFSVRQLRHWAKAKRYIIGSGATSKSKVCGALYKSTSANKKHSKKHKHQATGKARSSYGSNPKLFNDSSPSWKKLNKTRATHKPKTFRRTCNSLGKKSVVIYGRAHKLSFRRKDSKRKICKTLSPKKH
jgi:hypothetical protein